MALSIENSVKIHLGVFDGDAPAATISLWQSILPGTIKVHLEPSTGRKSYLYDQVPEGMGTDAFVQSLVNAGIVEARLGAILYGDRLITGWEDFEIIGTEVAQISPGVA